MNVQFVVHEAFEAPGAFETWARDRGHTVSVTRTYAGDALPVAVDDIDLLVVMGGPQSPSTTSQECPHFDAAAEQDLIARCVAADAAVIGVCLGAQLVGQALGAAYEHSPEKEIGKFPIEFTEAGRADARFAHFGERMDVGHWHGDMPGLTATATVIATSAGCPRQIVRYSDRVFGFQCHLEFTPAEVELLIEAEHALPGLRGHRFVQQADTLRANDWTEMNAALCTFLDRLT